MSAERDTPSIPHRVLTWADSFMHWLVARWGRHFYWAWLCDRMDIALGVPDTPENFPQRHGYVRLNHIYSGSSMWPERATCQHCGKRMEEGGQCLLVWPAR